MNKQPASAFDYGDLPEDQRRIAEEAAKNVRTGLSKLSRHVVQIGKELLKAREAVPEGRWGEWLTAQFEWTPRTAENLMNAASVFGGASEIISHVPASGIYLLAAPSTPAELRDEVIELIQAGETPSLPEIKDKVAKARGVQKRQVKDAEPTKRQLRDRKYRQQKREEKEEAERQKREAASQRERVARNGALAMIAERLGDRLDEAIKLLRDGGLGDFARWLEQARDAQQSPEPPDEESAASPADNGSAHNNGKESEDAEAA